MARPRVTPLNHEILYVQGVGLAATANAVPLTNSTGIGLDVNIAGGSSAGTQYAELATTSPGTGTLSLGRYKAAAPTLTDGQLYGLQLDASGNLKVTGSLSVGGTTDSATFTAASSTFTGTGGVFNDSIAALTSGTQGAFRVTTNRAQHVNLRTAAGVETGIAAAPLQVSLANTGANGTALTVGGTVAISGTVPVSMATNTPTLQAGSTTAVTQPTGTNLHTVVDSGTITAVTAITNALPIGANLLGKVGIDQTTVGTTNAVSLAQIGATTVVTGGVAGTLAVGGITASGSAKTGNPVRIGAVGHTVNPTAVTDAQAVELITDKLGKLVTVSSIRDLKANQTTTITASTAETTIVTSVAGVFLDLYGIIISNTSATAVNVAIKDATAGTTRFNIAVPAGDTRGFMLNESAAYKQSAVTNNWTATVSASVTSIIIAALTVQNL